MMHLYVIGNGFDIFTGLKTRYIDFRWWLENTYPFIYENMLEAYDMDVEWWNDFEVQLGKLDIKKYVNRFAALGSSSKKILEEIEVRRAYEEKHDLQPSVQDDCTSSRRLRGLLDILQYCFQKWIESCQKVITNPRYVFLQKDNSFFINFNYTDILQNLYNIPEECVIHIHGRSSKHERLVYGHNSVLLGGDSRDEELTGFELGIYEKNPYEYINRYDVLQRILKDVKCVHIYGFSFSPVDEDYIDWIYENVPVDAKWEVSWYSDTDKKRIDQFVLYHWRLKDRIRLMRLEEIEEIA